MCDRTGGHVTPVTATLAQLPVRSGNRRPRGGRHPTPRIPLVPGLTRRGCVDDTLISIGRLAPGERWATAATG